MIRHTPSSATFVQVILGLVGAGLVAGGAVLLKVNVFPAAALIGLGGIVLVHGVHTGLAWRRVERRMADHPDAPWMWNESWSDGRIRSSSKREILKRGTAAALYWLGIGIPVIQFLRDGEHPSVGMLLLPGIWLLGRAIPPVLQWLRFGASSFELRAIPGEIGGSLRGVAVTATKLDGGVDAILTCRRRVRTEHGGGEHLEILWQGRQRATIDLLEADPRRSAFAVSIGVHSRCEPIDAARGIEWTLVLEAETFGPNFRAEFDVPIYAADPTPLKTGWPEEPPELPPPARIPDGVSVEESGDELRVEIPGPHPSLGQWGMSGWLLFLILVFSWPDPWMFTILSGGVIAGVLTWRFWTRTRLALRGRTMEFRVAVLGVGRSQRVRVSRFDIELVDRGFLRPHHRLRVWPERSGLLHVGGSFEDKRSVQALADLMGKRL